MTDTSRPPAAASGDKPEAPDAIVVDIPRVEALLRDGSVSSLQGATLWGSNYAALVTVSDDTLRATAVYKPQRGERPLWDFPDGTLCYREAAAYLVSNALSWFLVPPTMLRHGPHGLGSLQLYVEHDPDINYFSLGSGAAEQLQRFALFDFIINNTDRKGGHLLLDPRGKLWGIDHGLTFHTTPKLRTVIWDFASLRVPDSLLRCVEGLSDQIETSRSPLIHMLEGMLTRAEIAATQRRVRHLVETRQFPRPGPGPNHPWPPV